MKLPIISLITSFFTRSLIGRYAINSIAATTSDFSIFHLIISKTSMDVVLATFLGALVGASISFLVLRYWVFRESTNLGGKFVLGKFILGVGLILLANVLFVSFFHHICSISDWPARILAACSAWLIGYFFNKRVVFAKNMPEARS